MLICSHFIGDNKYVKITTAHYGGRHQRSNIFNRKSEGRIVYILLNLRDLNNTWNLKFEA